MDLRSLLERDLDENLSTLNSDLASPEDISDMLFELTMKVQTTRARKNTC